MRNPERRERKITSGRHLDTLSVPLDARKGGHVGFGTGEVGGEGI